MDGQLLFDGDRWALRYEREFPCTVERLWRAVTEPDELAKWFPGRPRIELVPGGDAHYEDPEDLNLEIDPDLLHRTGVVQEIDPPKLFALTWGEDLLRFELQPEGEGSRLTFTYTFENRVGTIRSGSGWSVCLDMLGACLGGGPPAEDRWLAYVAAYNEELGSDGTCTRHGDIAVLRFERVLRHRAADVWQALTDPERLGRWLADATVEEVVGGAVVLRFANPRGYTVQGVITRLDRPTVIEHTWPSADHPDGSVKWQLIGAGETCLLLLTHTTHGESDVAAAMASWHLHLALLRNALAGLPTWPLPEARWQELRLSYGAALGS